MTLEDFMRIPTRLDWNREIEFGWPGPDGSTASTDHMMGVKIGVTSKAFEQTTGVLQMLPTAMTASSTYGRSSTAA